jgi:hypothetical protein
LFAAACQAAAGFIMQQSRSRLVETAMDYDQIDVLDQGVVWQGGALDAAIDSPAFAGPLLVVCMDRGENNEQFINQAIVEAALAVWIDDRPDGCLKDKALTGLADAIGAWLNARRVLPVQDDRCRR